MNDILAKYLRLIGRKSVEKMKEGIDEGIALENRLSYLLENRCLCAVPASEINQDEIKDIVGYLNRNHEKMGLLKCHKKFEKASYVPKDDWIMENLILDIVSGTFMSFEYMADTAIEKHGIKQGDKSKQFKREGL